MVRGTNACTLVEKFSKDVKLVLGVDAALLIFFK